MDAKEYNSLRRGGNISLFHNLDAAWRWAYGMKAGIVVMGDVGEYLVCTMRTASRLMKAGYELAPR
tara:strand:+ start:761 stop:958 length:198 start_codon:yes stop_codon:yes gene_type:complete